MDAEDIVCITIILLLVGGVVFSAITAGTYLFGTEYCTHTYTPLKSISDSSRITGSFFLGSGTIRSSPQFVFYSGNSNTGYILETRYASHSRIFMDRNINPVLDTVTCYRKSVLSPFPDQHIDESYYFHVPENTIITQYVLDSNI